MNELCVVPIQIYAPIYVIIRENLLGKLWFEYRMNLLYMEAI